MSTPAVSAPAATSSMRAAPLSSEDPKSSSFFPAYKNDFQFQIQTYDIRIEHRSATFEHFKRIHKLVKTILKTLASVGSQEQLEEYHSIRSKLKEHFINIQKKIDKPTAEDYRAIGRKAAYKEVEEKFKDELTNFRQNPEKFIDKFFFNSDMQTALTDKIDRLAHIHHFTHIGNFAKCVITLKELKALGSKRLTFTRNGIEFFSVFGRALDGVASYDSGNTKDDSPNSLENLVDFAKLMKKLRKTAYTIAASPSRVILPFAQKYIELYTKAREHLLLLQCRYFKTDKSEQIPKAIKILDKVFENLDPWPIPIASSRDSTMVSSSSIKKKAVLRLVPGFSLPNGISPLLHLFDLLQPDEKGIIAVMPYMHKLKSLPGMSNKPFLPLVACFLFDYYSTLPADLLDETKFNTNFETLKADPAKLTTFLGNIKTLENEISSRLREKTVRCLAPPPKWMMIPLPILMRVLPTIPPLLHLFDLLQPDEKGIIAVMPYMDKLKSLPGMSDKPFLPLVACFLFDYYSTPPADLLDETKFNTNFETLKADLAKLTTFLGNIATLEKDIKKLQENTFNLGLKKQTETYLSASFRPEPGIPPLGYLSFLLQPHKQRIKDAMPYMCNLKNLPGMSDRPFSALVAAFLVYYYSSSDVLLDESAFNINFTKLKQELLNKVTPSTFAKNIDELMDYVTATMKTFDQEKKDRAAKASEEKNKIIGQYFKTGIQAGATVGETGAKVMTAASAL